MSGKLTIQDYKDIIENQKSQIEFLEIANQDMEDAFELVKRFMNILVDDTFPEEKLKVINNSNKITLDEIEGLMILFEIPCEVI